MAQHHCIELAEKSETLRKHLRKCEDTGVIDPYEAILGCMQGAGSMLKDTGLFAIRATAVTWHFLSGGERRDAIASCLGTPCARDIQGRAGPGSYSDAKKNPPEKLNGNQLAELWQRVDDIEQARDYEFNRKGYLALKKISALKPFSPEWQKELEKEDAPFAAHVMQVHNAPQGERIDQAIVDLVMKKVDEEFSQFRCADPQLASAMVCYAAATLAGPKVAATALEKLPLLVDVLKPAASGTRAGLIKTYVSKVFSTAAENRRFMDLAASTRAVPGTVFVDIENSALKLLNDTTKDKNLVTSLTNRYKAILDEKLAEFQKLHPGLEIIKYNDFKSTRLALRGNLPEGLEAALNSLFVDANKQFMEEMAKMQIVQNAALAAFWFRAGFGNTADQANLAARASRDMPGTTPKMYSYQEVKPRLEKDLTKAHVERLRLDQDKALDTLMTGIHGQRVPTREAFDLIRKNHDDPAKLMEAIRNRTGELTFSRARAQHMIDYADLVDSFSPGISFEKREIVNLNKGAYGGFTVDFLGLGSANQMATAQALMRASSSLDNALELTRLAEREVTTAFQAKLDRLKEMTKNVKCTGDDCASAFTSPKSEKYKQDLLNSFAADPLTREVRVSFIPDGILRPAQRTLISSQGESIEKNLRVALEGVIPGQRLTSITFAIDMNVRVPNFGNISALTAVNGAPITAAERQMIDDALKKVVANQNKLSARAGLNSNYVAIGRALTVIRAVDSLDDGNKNH
jgi:hypothetical protein